MSREKSVNRSGISLAIATAVLCSASGFANAVPAAAEPSQPGHGNGSDAAAGVAGKPARSPRGGARGVAAPDNPGGTAPGGGAVPGRSTGTVPLWQWPCHWPVVPPVIPPDVEDDAGRGAEIPAMPGFALPVVPEAQIFGGVQRTTPEPGDLEVLPDGRALPVSPGSSSAVLPQGPVWVGQPAPAVPSGPAGPAWSTPVPADIAPAAVLPAVPAAAPAVPAAQAPPRGVPSAPVPQAAAPGVPETLRAGYPERLRTADAAALAAQALPGLAVILGLTAVGGLLGYRQAKAGSALHAAGVSRFLQGPV